MRTHWMHGPGRIWRAPRGVLSGAAAVLTIGAIGILGSAPAQAMNNEGPLTAVFVVQPTTTQVNTAVTPAVVVQVEGPNGQVDKDYNGPVLLQYAVNRLGAPLPTGNEVNAYCGIATFKDLTFSAVGFGFELKAVIPAESEGPPPSQPGSGWTSGQGGTWTSGQGGVSAPTQGSVSAPSAPFDIVDQILQCEPEDNCQTETVSSSGTSGSAQAAASDVSGTLEATGGGFPRLSCTSVGGVVSFSSTLAKTITISFAGSLGEQPWNKSVSVCWGSPTPFITKSGFPARFNPANDEFEGLLPHCGAFRPEPCVSSVWIGSWGVRATIQAPTGDPHMTF